MAVSPNPFLLPDSYYQWTLDVFVPGLPAPQGSKRHLGRGVMVESSSRVKPWRADVREAVTPLGFRFDEPVSVRLWFSLPRPKKTRHPTAPAGPPDLDKLARAVLDALESAGVLTNDARVVNLHARKSYAPPGQPSGARIIVRKWTDEHPD